MSKQSGSGDDHYLLVWCSMSVPPRWIPCPRKGQIIDGESSASNSLRRYDCHLLAGKFLPFKTPLSSRYDGDIPEEDRFNIDMVVSVVEGKQLRMGLVVDLTKTDRFYDKQTLLNYSIGYHKLQCEGYVHGVCFTDSLK